MIMKQVSKCWQDIKKDKFQTEKYEYLSLRDRETYALLCKFCQDHRNQLANEHEEAAHISLRSHDIHSHFGEHQSSHRVPHDMQLKDDDTKKLSRISEEHDENLSPNQDPPVITDPSAKNQAELESIRTKIV